MSWWRHLQDDYPSLHTHMNLNAQTHTQLYIIYISHITGVLYIYYMHRWWCFCINTRFQWIQSKWNQEECCSIVQWTCGHYYGRREEDSSDAVQSRADTNSRATLSGAALLITCRPENTGTLAWDVRKTSKDLVSKQTCTMQEGQGHECLFSTATVTSSCNLQLHLALLSTPSTSSTSLSSCFVLLIAKRDWAETTHACSGIFHPFTPAIIGKAVLLCKLSCWNKLNPSMFQDQQQLPMHYCTPPLHTLKYFSFIDWVESINNNNY